MGEAMTETARMMTQDNIQTSQKRFHIAGHSLKKCESYKRLPGGNEEGVKTYLDLLDGDAHCMLYPTKCATLSNRH